MCVEGGQKSLIGTGQTALAEIMSTGRKKAVDNDHRGRPFCCHLFIRFLPPSAVQANLFIGRHSFIFGGVAAPRWKSTWPQTTQPPKEATTVNNLSRQPRRFLVNLHTFVSVASVEWVVLRVAPGAGQKQINCSWKATREVGTADGSAAAFI